MFGSAERSSRRIASKTARHSFGDLRREALDHQAQAKPAAGAEGVAAAV